MQVPSANFTEGGDSVRTVDVLIVGGGQAGGRTAEALRTQGFSGSIALVGREPCLPYERPALSKAYLMGQEDEQGLQLHPSSFWQEQSIDLYLGCEVRQLDRAAQRAMLADGRWLGYRHLVVATGGDPRRLDVPGDGAADVMALRTVEDSQRIRAAMKPGSKVLVIGAGVIGMELASSACALGAQVEVLEAGPRVMGRILCPATSGWLAELHQAAGVTLHLNTRLERIDRSGSGLAVRMTHQDGSERTSEADLVVAAIGVSVGQPFLRDSGLGDEDGMEVDEYCRSRIDPHCYAAGDVARTPVPYFGRPSRQETWRNADSQAKAVAASILGGSQPYEETPWMWTDQHGRNIQVVGVAPEGMQPVTRGEPGAAAFAVLWVAGGRLRGGVLVDSGRERRTLEQLVRSGRPIDANLLNNPEVPLKSLL